jgi:hypothetical protein
LPTLWLVISPGLRHKCLRCLSRFAKPLGDSGGSTSTIPEAAAHLWLGLSSGLQYAKEIGAIGGDEVRDLKDNCWKAFLDLGRDQERIVEDEKPTRRFLDVVFTIVTQERGVLLSTEENQIDQKPGVEFLGWRDESFLYLLPEAAFSAVSRFCRDTAEPFPIRQQRLRQNLAKEGISECDSGRFTTTIKVGTQSKRVLKINLKAAQALLHDEIVVPTTVYHRYHRYEEGERDGL